MPFTRTSFIRSLKILLAILITAIIVSYAIWRSLNYARGPHIDIFEPTNGSAISTATTTIRGQALRINDLKLNGNSVLMDESGHFSEIIILFPGINRLTVAGYDQFGRNTQTLLEIVGKASLPEAKSHLTLPIATSTATTTATTTDE